MVIRLIRLLFFPLSILYGFIIDLRNYQFNKGLKSMVAMEPTIISVGNLSTGGTGKTPIIEYLVRLLQENHRTAVLSRGYGRKTRGFRLANGNDTAKSIGDEPLQYYRKYGEQIKVVVSEERVLGVSSLLLDHPETELFLLDDAYQHRFLKRDLNILLTSFDQPFYQDWLLPTGNLREPRREAKRADVVIVTKCPEGLTEEQKAEYENGVDNYNSNVTVFFSQINYANPIGRPKGEEPAEDILLITGIANPSPLVSHLEQDFQIKKHFSFPDHYQFRNRDLDEVENFARENGLKSILTTEKDMVRLLSQEEHSIFKNCSLFYVPIVVEIDKSEAFDELVFKTLKRKANL